MEPAAEKYVLHLVFVPLPWMGHLVSTVELASLLLHRDHRLSVTVIILNIPCDRRIAAYASSVSTHNRRLNFVVVPLYQPGEIRTHPNPKELFARIEEKKYLVKEVVNGTGSGSGSGSGRVAGFVVDMFCTCMIDVANELGVPSYLYFTSGAAFLAYHFYVQELVEEKKVDTTAFKDSDELLDMPFFRRRFPAKLAPVFTLMPEMVLEVVKVHRRFREMKGMMVNSFEELEPCAMEALLSDQTIPPVYSVGPILNHDSGEGNEDVMAWLDGQPSMSVVFLCFGTMGRFGAEQVREIAAALERSGRQFLWSLRRSFPTDYDNVEDILPEGFLARMAGIGKVIGWAPQTAVLDHPAVGGFVSHCGWNSVLESLWYGIPVAAWPMYAEQQLNTFEMVKELGLGVEVRMEYRMDLETGAANGMVPATEIERAIGELMAAEMRERVKKMSEKSRRAVTEGGSSYSNLARFIKDIMLTKTSDFF